MFETSGTMLEAPHSTTAKDSAHPGANAPVEPPLDLSIAIVSHHHGRFLEDCLGSIYAHTHRVRFEIGLVDNVGETAVQQLIRQRFPRVHLRLNDRRKGFSENNNLILADSTARYCFLLNPDTVVQPGAIDRLVEHMDAHPRAGACGPKLLYPDGRLQLNCRRFPSFGAVLLRRTPLRWLFGGSKLVQRYSMADWSHDHPESIDWLFGAAILIRREALQTVGLLDPNLFLYCEDIDWCLRCHQAGWDIHFVPEAVITHHLDDDKYNRFFTKHRLMHYKTMWQFFRKHPRRCLRW